MTNCEFYLLFMILIFLRQTPKWLAGFKGMCVHAHMLVCARHTKRPMLNMEGLPTDKIPDKSEVC